MHFWIDKRSQACGFGRARVSASLSGAGGGVGLGFTHPHRRIGGNKTFASVPTIHRQHQHLHQHHQNQNQSQSQHQHHHHHHQQQSLHHQQQLQQQQHLQQLQQQQQLHIQQQQQQHQQLLQLQQQQQQQQQQHRLQYQQSANYSNSSSAKATTSTADCHARSCTLPGIINNNNNAASASAAAAAANNISRSISSGNICVQQQQMQQIQVPGSRHQSTTHSINNNAHLQQQLHQRQPHQQHQHPQQAISTCPIIAANNISTYRVISNNNNNNNNQNNNNTSNTNTNTSNTTQLPPSAATSSLNNSATGVVAATSVALTCTGTSAPVATSASGRYGRNQHQHQHQHQHHHHHQHQHQQQEHSVTQQQPAVNQLNNHGVHHHYDTRNYHHPQFGNMSVRHYQCATDSNQTMHTNCTTVGAMTSHSTLQAHTQSARATVGNHPQFSATAMITGAAPYQECRNASQTSGMLQQHLNSPHLQYVCGGIGHSESSETAGNVTNGPVHTRPPSHQHAAAHRGNMRATTNGIIDDAETQPMLTQLKCGMWTSLVLASVFVAGAKFYFDNQGTGLEVIIFCTFSATFFLAACTVSLCRLVTPRHLSEHSRGLLPGSQGVVGGATDRSTSEHHLFGQSNQQRLHESQERTAAAQAGPPPYHIAILLPEHRKDAVTDESPPPSYDKILI